MASYNLHDEQDIRIYNRQNRTGQVAKKKKKLLRRVEETEEIGGGQRKKRIDKKEPKYRTGQGLYAPPAGIKDAPSG